MVFDERSRVFRVEGVLHLDGDVLDADRVDGRRIDDLGTKVTKLHRLDIRQFVDGIGCLDDTRVCGHETVYIRPYLQYLGIDGCCDDGSGIVRAASSEVGGFPSVAVA